MKKLLLSVLSLGFVLGLSAQTLTEVYVPQYLSGKTAASAGNARVPLVVMVQVAGLTPNTSYDVKAGICLTSEANTTFGAGNYWNGTSFSTAVWANAFTTDASGNSGNVWLYIQPTGNASRFTPGALHNIRYGFVANGNTMPSQPTFVGAKTLTALDLGTTELTVATNDDGAYIVGNSEVGGSGKYILAYNNVAGTGDPIAIYRVKSHSINQGTNTELPTSVNDIYLGTNNTPGAYALLIPIGANNTNGIRRLETRNADGTLHMSSTDADGIWPGGANTTTITRRSVATILSTDAPLPVKYSSFTASKTADGNLLKWSTASENNNSNFEVQRSTNDGQFVTIGMVKGAGNSTAVKNYSFVDADKVSGTACYRLKQVDFNGKTDLSKEVCVTPEKTVQVEMNTTPNPFNGSLTVNYGSANEGSATVEIIDVIGKLHYSGTETLVKGNNTFNVNTEALPHGVYFVRISNGNHVKTQRIIKK